MSDYGLLVKNNNDQTIIDSTFNNLYVHQYGSISNVSYFNFNPVINSAYTPIIAFRPPTNRWVFHERNEMSGSNYARGIFKTKAFGGGNFNIAYVVFSEERVAGTPEYGLIVNNSDGNMVFSSEEKFMKIVGVYNGSIYFCNAGSEGKACNEQLVNVSDADNNYFIVAPTVFNWYSWRGGSTRANQRVFNYHLRAIRKSSSTKLQIGCVHWDTYTLPYTNDPGISFGIWSVPYTIIEVSF